MLLVIHLCITAVFILLGIVFFRGKGAWLIAGYNTLSEAEKSKIDVKKLCRNMSKLMFALAACWLVVASSEIFKIMALIWVGLLLFIIVIIVGCIYMNTSNRNKK